VLKKRDYHQRRIQGGGLLGLSPPGPVKSVDFRGVSCPWKEKNFKPPLDKFLNTPLIIIMFLIFELYVSFSTKLSERNKIY